MRILSSVLVIALLLSDSSAIKLDKECCPKTSCEVIKKTETCGCSGSKAAKEEADDDDEESGAEVEKAIEKMEKKKENKE